MKKLIFILFLLLILGFCKKENTTEPGSNATIFGNVKLLSELRNEYNYVLGDTTIVIDGLKVLLQDEIANKTVSSTITNNLGEYTFSGIKLGYYSVKSIIELDTVKIESNESEAFQLAISGMSYPVELLYIPSGVDLSDRNVTIYAPYPNPGITVTTIELLTFQAINVKIYIFNHQGELVRNLWNEVISPDHYGLIWDFRDNNETTLPPGIYYILAYNGSECLYYHSVIKK